MLSELETLPSFVDPKPDFNLARMEEQAIRDALFWNGNNRMAAARDLGITARSLRRKILLYGLPTLPACRGRYAPTGVAGNASL
jgi:DNA-binding NtrC family response regulator